MPERDFHTATYIEGKVVVFGGRCKLTNIALTRFNNDLLLLLPADIIAPDFSNQDIYDTAFYEYLLSKYNAEWTMTWGLHEYHIHSLRR